MHETIEVKEVLNAGQLKQFINLPWKIYQDCPYWVPPLKSSIKEILSPKHPFYASAKIKKWLIYVDGIPCGRIAAIINHLHQSQVGHLGFFECINRSDLAFRLFNQAFDFLRSEGMQKALGPLSPSTNYESGVLIDGFDDPPQLMMSYNPTYYPKLFESQGMYPVKDLLAFNLDLQTRREKKGQVPELVAQKSKRLQESKGILFRPLNKSKWKQDAQTILEIYNEAWEDNWGHIPLSKDEFILMVQQLKSLVDEDLLQLVFVKGRPAGVLFVVPDYNQVLKKIPSGKLFPTGIFKFLKYRNKIDRARVVLLGVKKKYRMLGLSTHLYQKLDNILAGRPALKSLEMSWILEDNLNMIRPIRLLGASEYKRYRLYEKLL